MQRKALRNKDSAIKQMRFLQKKSPAAGLEAFLSCEFRSELQLLIRFGQKFAQIQKEFLNPNTYTAEIRKFLQ